MLQTFTLKNGLQVATYSLPKLRSVNLDLSVKGGSIFENKKNASISHLTEHLLLQGTPTYPDSESLSEYIESLAGSYNAFTYGQVIRFFINGPVIHLKDILKVASEVFFQSLFTDKAVDKEKSAISQELRGYTDSLNFKLSKFYSSIRYQSNHPLRLNSEDGLETIPKLRRENLISWWKKFFIPANTYLVLAGGFSDKEAKSLAQDCFFGLESKNRFAGYPNFDNNDFSSRQVAIRHDEKLNSTYVDLSWPSITDSQPIRLRLVQNILRSILGGLSTSRLFRLLRQKTGLVYSVSCGASIYLKFGSFYISTEVALDKLEIVIDLIVKEMVALLTNGPIEAEVEFVKNYSINRTLMSWDHPANIADWVRSDLMWEERIYKPEEIVDIIRQVSVPDVVEFMRKHWELDKLNLIIQGPVEDSIKNKEKYSQLVADIK